MVFLHTHGELARGPRNSRGSQKPRALTEEQEAGLEEAKNALCFPSYVPAWHMASRKSKNNSLSHPFRNPGGTGTPGFCFVRTRRGV